MRKFFTRFSAILLSIILLLKCSGNEHMFKALRSTYMVGKTGPTVDDHKIFENRKVKATLYRDIPNSLGYDYYKVDSVVWKEIETYDPLAFLVVRNEQIILEHYWDGYDDASRTNSFSVAKSIVGLAILKAIELGHIESVDQKVIDFVPELEGDYREDVSIRHLLQMTSGIDFNESYGNPFGFMAAAYYGENLEEKTLSYDADDEPGSEWEYLGGNTILLSIIVNRATGQTLSDFVSNELWTKMGAPFDALWSLDAKDGLEKAYCCFYTSARDFARFGLLVEGNGFMLGKSCLDRDLIAELKKPVVLNNGEIVPHYGWHWWKINYEGVDITYARGIFGQYIITIPDYDMVVVRLGHKRGKTNEENHPEDLYLYLDLAKKMYDQSVIPF